MKRGTKMCAETHYFVHRTHLFIIQHVNWMWSVYFFLSSFRFNWWWGFRRWILYMLMMLFMHNIRCMYVRICAVICKYVLLLPPPPLLRCSYFFKSFSWERYTRIHELSNIIYTYLCGEIQIFKRVEQKLLFNALQMYNSLFVFQENMRTLMDYWWKQTRYTL